MSDFNLNQFVLVIKVYWYSRIESLQVLRLLTFDFWLGLWTWTWIVTKIKDMFSSGSLSTLNLQQFSIKDLFKLLAPDDSLLISFSQFFNKPGVGINKKTEDELSIEVMKIFWKLMNTNAPQLSTIAWTCHLNKVWLLLNFIQSIRYFLLQLAFILSTIVLVCNQLDTFHLCRLKQRRRRTKHTESIQTEVVYLFLWSGFSRNHHFTQHFLYCHHYMNTASQRKNKLSLKI